MVFHYKNRKKKMKTLAIPLTILLGWALQFLTSHPSGTPCIDFERRRFISIRGLFWKLILTQYVYNWSRRKLDMNWYHLILSRTLGLCIYTEYYTAVKFKGGSRLPTLFSAEPPSSWDSSSLAMHLGKLSSQWCPQHSDKNEIKHPAGESKYG